MTQFIPYDENVEVNGETVLTTVNSFPDFMRSIALKMLEGNGIKDPQPGEWYSQKAWLDSFKEINEKYGSNTLFEIGKGIPANAKFPPEVDSIEKALNVIDVAYHMNHRNGEIGFYKVISHDTSQNKIIMNVKTHIHAILTEVSLFQWPESSSLLLMLFLIRVNPQEKREQKTAGILFHIDFENKIIQ
jgi:hypothetical protein